jgi:predicted AAA+ superfamily ATPase
MKDIIANCEINYKKRRISLKINKLIDAFPVVVVSGARQVGKSTMLQHEFGDFDYVSLDDFDVMDRARIDPDSLWGNKERIIIDEVQKSPSLLSAIKREVDSSGRARKFLLSGSANLLLMKQVTESLAGRALYVDLFPLSYGEIHDIVTPSNFEQLWRKDTVFQETRLAQIDPLDYLLKGFMPPLLGMQDHTAVVAWLEGYVRTYLERDLRDLSQIDSLVDFRKVMRVLALRGAQVLNQADVAKDSGVSHATAHRYLKLLEISLMMHRVEAYAISKTKRIVKSPKAFFMDPGLSILLGGYFDRAVLENARELGSYFESMVYLHLRALCEQMTPKSTVFYWRTVSGAEVDFVIEHGRRLLAFEVKMTSSPSVRDIRHLLAFLKDYPETVRGVLVHGGNEVKMLHTKVIAVPWWWLDC